MKKALLLAFLISGYLLKAQSPGGVSSNIVFWFQADAGTSTTTNGATLTSWADQTGNGNTANQFSTGPDYLSILKGFNPAVDFSVTAGGFGIANDNGINTSASSAKSFSITLTTGSDVTTRQLVYEEGGGTHGLNLYIENGRIYNNLWVSSSDNAASTAIEANTTYILTFVYDGANTRWDSYLNGSAAFNDGNVQNSLPSHTGAIGLGVINQTTQYDGNQDVSSGDPFSGQVHEFAYYNNNVLNSTEINQIESYQATKYGVSLGSDYLASNGSTTFWSSATNAGFNNGITGIGRDNTLSDLNQKQNKSADISGLVSIGLGSIATSNANNSNSFSAVNDFMVWGHNNGAINFGTSGGAFGLLLDRVWKVQETGTVGNVAIQFPASTSSEMIKLPTATAINLLVDDNSSFSSPTIIPLTLNGNNWEATADLADAEFFTIAVPGAALSVTTNGDESGPVDIVYTVTLTSVNSTGNDIDFDFDDLMTGSATSGSDYAAITANAKITVTNGAQTGSFTITVFDDPAEENIESLEMSISNPSDMSVVIGASSALAFITDNDIATPAGVTDDLIFWYKANDGPSGNTDGASVTTWVDKSGNSNGASAISSGPVFSSIVSNFNPGVNFSSGGMILADNAFINNGSGSYNSKSYTIVLRTGNDVSTRQLVYEQGGGTNGMNIYISGNNLSTNLWNNSADNATSTAITPNTTYVVSYVYDGGNTEIDVYVNGSLSSNLPNPPSTLSNHSGDIGLGEITNDTQFNPTTDVSSGERFQGDILEMIYYDRQVYTAAERARLESYTAIKYGVTKSSDYISADETLTYWDISANIGFNNDITGIAADGESGLTQKQSKSENSDALITIGIGDIASDNIENTAAFGFDKSFLIWGNDDGALNGVADNTELTAQSGVIDQLQRVWKIVETGTIDSVQIAIPKDSIDDYLTYSQFENYHLRVADDASLTTNVVDIPLSEITVNGAINYAGKYDFSGVQYFSIIQKEFILWTGTEWRGGLSTLTDHGPSDELGDVSKSLFILAGDTAEITEGVQVDSLNIANSAVTRVNPAACLILGNGIANNGSLLMEASVSGYGQYNGPATTLTFQQFIDNEGWHLISSPFSDTDFDDISFENDNGRINHPLGGVSLDSCNYCNLWWYDPSTDNSTDIGFGSSNAFGTWRTSTDGTESFTATKGWNLHLDASSNFDTAPWTISISGTTNDADIDQTVNENNGGWNLVANPYSTSLDWDTVDDNLSVNGIAAGYHIWDESNANFATYASGVGTLGATNNIAPFQAYYVQTSAVQPQNESNIFRTFSISKTDRSTTCQTPSFYKKEKPLIRIKTTHLVSQKIDETLINFESGASKLFIDEGDIHKLFSSAKNITNVYSRVDEHTMSINTLDFPTTQDSIPLGVRAQNGTRVRIEIVEQPEDLTIFLEDLKTGIWHPANKPLSFESDARFSERFLLHFGDDRLNARSPALKPYELFIENGLLNIQIKRNNSGGNWALYSITGSLVREGNFVAGRASNFGIETSHIHSGIYIFTTQTNGQTFTEKISIVR